MSDFWFVVVAVCCLIEAGRDSVVAQSGECVFGTQQDREDLLSRFRAARRYVALVSPHELPSEDVKPLIECYGSDIGA